MSAPARCESCGAIGCELADDGNGTLLCGECFATRAAAQDGHPEDARRVAFDSAAEIRSERVHWLWAGRIALRSLAVFAGEKGLGKSITTNAWLAAQLTRGELDGELLGQPADVLVCSGEDDWASVIKPRLMAHGADLDRVHRVRVLDEAGESLLTFPDDAPLLEQEIERLRAEGRVIALLVVDPIGAFLSAATDSHRDASVRRALAPLAASAERLGLAVCVVAHLTKDESRRLIARVSGSGAFVNAARSVLVFAPDPDDPKGESGCERVLVHVRSNWGRLAPSLAARVESRDVKVDDGSTTDVGYLLMKGESSIGIEDLQRGADEDASDVEELIAAALADGPRPSREVKPGVADAAGCSKRTVERAAMRMKDRGELAIESGGFPRTTTWALGSGDSGTHGGDTAGSDNPEHGAVVTGSYAVVTGISTLSGDNRESPNAGGDTGFPTCSCTPAPEGRGPDGDPGERCERCRGVVPV